MKSNLALTLVSSDFHRSADFWKGTLVEFLFEPPPPRASVTTTGNIAWLSDYREQRTELGAQ